jgi:hypothetical protein
VKEVHCLKPHLCKSDPNPGPNLQLQKVTLVMLLHFSNMDLNRILHW